MSRSILDTKYILCYTSITIKQAIFCSFLFIHKIHHCLLQQKFLLIPPTFFVFSSTKKVFESNLSEDFVPILLLSLSISYQRRVLSRSVSSQSRVKANTECTENKNKNDFLCIYHRYNH